jgi:hypothetical protein
MYPNNIDNMKYECSFCKYASNYRSHFEDHLKTKKHEKNVEGSHKVKNESDRVQYCTLSHSKDDPKNDSKSDIVGDLNSKFLDESKNG